MNVLGIDPGREKMGLAVIDATGAVLWRAIITPSEFAKTLPAVLREWSIQRIALGHSTASRSAQSSLSPILASLGGPTIEVAVIDETGSTLEARGLYWEAKPLIGWRRLVPLSLQVPPEPLDDFAAAVIARRSLLPEQKVLWAAIIADEIEKNLACYRQGQQENLGFESDYSQFRNFRSDSNSTKQMRDLSAAWNFADSFFDAATHGFATLDNIPWNEAEELLADIVIRLRDGKPLEDARVLRYSSNVSP